MRSCNGRREDEEEPPKLAHRTLDKYLGHVELTRVRAALAFQMRARPYV
jgi:hypothetical protein